MAALRTHGRQTVDVDLVDTGEGDPTSALGKSPTRTGNASRSGVAMVATAGAIVDVSAAMVRGGVDVEVVARCRLDGAGCGAFVAGWMEGEVVGVVLAW